ncbi:MAG: S1 family peptidase [Verrucomicrobiota bacterium]|nr:S1 family peptidase [Verrucomicrobiota bacterium]
MSKSFLAGLCKSLGALASLLLPFSLSAATPPGLLDNDHASVRAVMAVQHEVTAGWMQQPEVLGTAIGVDAAGTPSLVVYIDRDADNAADVARSFPAKARGVGVRVELTDKFRAMARPGGGGGGVSHTARQTPPIQLGTSGGWAKDLANGYCCGGTLGSLVLIGGQQHILSNYHVLEADIVSGGNGTVATTGDSVIQPGLIDINCTAANGQSVATLVKKSALPNSNVDCAVAKVTSGMVSTTGAILEIGPISSQTIGASIGQAVKKSGRTTGLTRSSISGLNATISVAYDNECAGGAAFTKTFTGQIVISNKGSRFLAGGDSGSLMVEDTATSPRAVGLLYAGSSSTAIANPIGHVLQFLGATMVGTP